MKKRLIFLGFLSLSVLINAIILLIFKDKFIHREQLIASLTSFIALILMMIMVLMGILSYFNRRKGNLLSFGTARNVIWIIERNCTYTEEQRRDFYWKFILFWFVIPFHIPCIIFSTKEYHALWSLALFFIPQIVYFISEVTIPMHKEKKKQKLIREKEEQEQKEQQKREEMGYFK